MLVLFLAAVTAVVQRGSVSPGLVGFAISYALQLTSVRTQVMAHIALHVYNTSTGADVAGAADGPY